MAKSITLISEFPQADNVSQDFKFKLRQFGGDFIYVGGETEDLAQYFQSLTSEKKESHVLQALQNLINHINDTFPHTIIDLDDSGEEKWWGLSFGEVDKTIKMEIVPKDLKTQEQGYDPSLKVGDFQRMFDLHLAGDPYYHRIQKEGDPIKFWYTIRKDEKGYYLFEIKEFEYKYFKGSLESQGLDYTFFNKELEDHQGNLDFLHSVKGEDSEYTFVIQDGFLKMIVKERNKDE